MEMAASAVGKMVLDVSGNSFRILPNSISEQMNSELEHLLSPPELENLEPLRLLDLRENYMPPELEHHLLRPQLENLRNLEFKPLLPPEVVRNDMPSKSWGINLEKFPPLPERRDAEHGSFTLRRLLPTPSKPSSQILTYVI